MTPSPQQSPRRRVMTPEQSTNTDIPQSGFTAVNGTSPSIASSTNHDHQDHPKRSSSTLHQHSRASPGKRKEAAESTSPSSEHNAKKQRTTEAGEHHSSTSSISDIYGQDASREETRSRSERHANDSSWTSHQSKSSTGPELNLAEVLQSDISSQRMAALGVAQDDLAHNHQRFPLEEPGTQLQHFAARTLPLSQKQLQKQRKSNRTKTGCLTCRERKKKCDEGKPQCLNCERGGFQCKGYNQTGPTTFKSTIPRDQPPLQAKYEYYDNQSKYPVPAPMYYEMGVQPDGRRPPPIEDGRDHARIIPQPQEPSLRIGSGYRPQHWSEPSMPLQYGRDGAPRADYQQVPPLREYSHHHKSSSHSLPAPIHPPHHRNLSQSAQTNGESLQYQRGQSASYANQRLLAQSALDHQTTQQTFVDTNLSEKQKMLKGFAFDRHDPKLKEERFRCSQAIYRFNKNAIEPGNLSEASRREQFRQILEGSKDDSSPNNRKRRSISPRNERILGHLGLRVEIEAPFYCDYGYNINIGDDVEIGPNCRIMDSCHVEIGPRSIIGPDVKILTLDINRETYQPGKKRNCKAKRIVIGEDVFIGAGAIILPGIDISKGACIGAGVTVSRSVKAPISVVPSWRQQEGNTQSRHGTR